MKITRNAYCGNLRLEDVDKEVALCGFARTIRKLGSITFIDLVDATGTVQIIEEDPSFFPDVRNEYVLMVEGKVRKKKDPNPKLLTGAIEVVASKITVLSKAENPPFIIADKSDALEETRLVYRYLDLRRPVLQKNLRTRAKILTATRKYLEEHGFLEVETPYMGLSSPEGATEYLVPSRVHPGAFYALDQSPQQYKQLLMIAGLERYYQIARCFRDEDLRADRQPEFTQIDMEMSYLDQEEILTLMEGLLAAIFKEAGGIEIKTPLRRMPYAEAVGRYGSDKPDTRYGMLLEGYDELLGKGFMNKEDGKAVRGFVLEGGAAMLSRKKQDELNLEAQKFGFRSYVYLRLENGTLLGSFVKFLNEEEQAALIKKAGLKEGDALILAYGDYEPVCFGLGALRTKLANELGLVKPNTYDLLWVVDFPMFEKREGEDGYKALHHPFTRPRDEDLPLLDTDPTKVLSYAYDIIINGYEAGGGTLRIYDHDIQEKIFEVMGLSAEEAEKKFGWFLGAFRYGVPPHGGIALGLERLSMILCGTSNIRDVLAFPKNLQATDPMTKAPQKVDQSQLDLLGLSIKE